MSVEIIRSANIEGAAKEFSDAEWRRYDHQSYGQEWNKEDFALTAMENGEIVGTADGWFCMGVGFLATLLVKAESRGSGIGRKLLEAFEQLAREKSVSRLALQTQQNGKALAFYQHLGWQQECVMEDWYCGGTHLQLRKDLSLE